MPIISPVERRTLKGRALLSLVYLLLLLGGITTIYPFMLMVRLSTADAVDQKRLDPVPAFWWDRNDLSKKFLLKRYSNGDAKVTNPNHVAARGVEWTAANYAELKDFWKSYYSQFDLIPVEQQRTQIKDYQAFLASLPPTHYAIADWDSDQEFLTYSNFLRYKLRLTTDEMATCYQVKPDATIRDWHPRLDHSYELTLQYSKWTKPRYRYALLPAWVQYLKAKYGQFDVDKVNSAHHRKYTSWTEVYFPLEAPAQKVERADYFDYIKTQFPLMWVKINGDFQGKWVEYLVRDKGLRTPEQYKNLTGLETPSMSVVPLPVEMPTNEALATLWSEFVFQKVPVESRVLLSPDRLYVAYLKAKYGSLGSLSKAWGQPMKSWADVRFADSLVDYRSILDDSLAIRRSMTVEPYGIALRELATQGRALLNTVLLMALSLFAALSVNPLAAYALSRFRIKGTHKILLFILATMALPGEIAMVPSFLLVKNLGLMNSYWALILPGAASAFGIFLLKGFFDSLPSELYEAATLDGAPEVTIFMRITMPLAKPILAVTAMGAVLGAYGTFVPAILYLQDTNMWPIMPRLFTLVGRIDGDITYSVTMASLVISSIPTLLVFLFAQRQIMRGIILPSFK